MGITMGGSPAVKFSDVGDTVEGTITGLEEIPLCDYDTGEPILWSNGTTKTQIRVSLQTNFRNHELIDAERAAGDDDGERALYVKGHLYTALSAAVRTAGSKTLDVGGAIKARFDSLGEAKKKSYHPPKLFKVRYTPPAAESVAMGPPEEDF